MNPHLFRVSPRQLPLTTALLLLVLISCAAAQTPPTCDFKALPATGPSKYSIGGEERHCFKVELGANVFFQARVEQQGVDLLLRLLDAGGKELAQMNSPNDADGPEVLSFVGEAAGTYTLQVTLLDAASGRKGAYAISFEPPRAATPRDRRRVEVERTLSAGMLARRTDGQLAAAIEKLSEAEAGWRELGDNYLSEITARKLTQMRAVVAFRAGFGSMAGQPTAETLRAGLAKLEEAGRLFHQAADLHGEAGSLVGRATISFFLGQKKSSRALYQQALDAYRQLHDRPAEADMLASIIGVSLALNDKGTALEYLQQTVPLYNGMGLTAQEATSENDIGSIYHESGAYDLALQHLERALSLRQNLPDKCALAATLTNIGAVYLSRGEKARALDFFDEKVMPLYGSSENCPDARAATLNNIGEAYYDLGANDLALEKYKQALPLATSDDKSVEAGIRNNIGAANFALALIEASYNTGLATDQRAAAAAAARTEEALASYKAALSLYERLADTRHQATTMTNIGVVQTAAGKYADAQDTFQKALALRRKAGDENGEAVTLNNMGEAFAAAGDRPRALEHFRRALLLFRATGDGRGEAVALSNAMDAWQQLGNRRMAIFYGKQSVNDFQELRGAARRLDYEIQKSYLRTIKGAYQQLAGLLIEEGAHDQAVRILNLYQDQQFFDFNLDATEPVQQIDYSEREHELVGRYRAAADAVGRAVSRLAELRRQIGDGQPSTDEAARLQQLEAELKAAGDAAMSALKGAEAEFARPPDVRDRVAEPGDVGKMRAALRALGGQPRQKAVALYTLVGADKLYVLLLTPAGTDAFSYPVKATEIDRRVERLLGFLEAPALSPQEASAALYNVIFGARAARGGETLSVHLERHKPDLLLWSLNGSLNHIPVAALYDEKSRQYLVEKYQNSVFTRADSKRLLREPQPWKTGIGFGKTGPSARFCPTPHKPGDKPLAELPSTAQELSAIFRGAPGRPALVSGSVVLDAAFSRVGLIDSLKGHDTPLVHIASHFCFQPGDAKGSFLLLGDDNMFPVYEMKEHRDLFKGVDLLVLAACKSAAQRSDWETGKEIDSLAELSQRLGAGSVIASLWNVQDEGASALLIEFYRLRSLTPLLSKAEALRQAQLNLLKGSVTRPEADLKHPSHWSAFVLYGGFR